MTPPVPPHAAGRAHPRGRAALLSALVFPGVGQLATGSPWRGLAFAAGTAILLAAVLVRVVRETLGRLPRDPLEVDASLPFRVAADVHRAHASFFLWATVALVALWAGSIADAWYGTKER